MGRRTPVWRHQYDVDADDAARAASDHVPEGESLTQHQFAESADINVLARRFGLTGALPPGVAVSDGVVDLRDVPDLRGFLDIQRDAKERWHALPAHIRARFAHNPLVLMNWLNDQANFDEAVKLGFYRASEKPPQEESPPAS